jgi:hypothetical protein
MITQEVVNQKNPFEPLKIEIPYNLKDSIIALMFIPELKLSGLELLKQNALALKIEGCKEGCIMLEETEWERIKRAVDTFQGFTRKDVGLVERVTNAEQIDINNRG